MTNMQDNNSNIDSNSLRLAALLSDIDPDLIAEAMADAAPRPRRKGPARLLLLVAAIAVLFSFTSMAFAINVLQQQNHNFYLRLLSPQELSDLALATSYSDDTDTTPDAKRLFAALKSDDIYTQYIAINRLVELYNDPALRSQACAKLQPFLTDPEPKLADAAAYAYDILSGQFTSPRLCHMADGSVFFTLFPDYSDYGSHNQLWQLKDGQLSPRVTFSEPYNYITDLLPSPDGKLLAVGLCSNKSDQLVIIDYEGGYWSPELVSSTRTLWPMQLGGSEGRRRRADCRVDNETYSSFRQLKWLDNSRLQYYADLAYDDNDIPGYCAIDIVDYIQVIYDFQQNAYEFSEYELNLY